MRTELLRRTGAEAVGTFMLVLAGCGAIAVNQQTGSLGHIGVALVFGLIVTVMIAATGHISGAHFNPAVTIAFACTRHFRWREVPFYVGSQVAAAILAAFTLRGLFGDSIASGVTLPTGSIGQSFLIEILLSAALMFVIIAVATDNRANGVPAGLAIGFTVTIDALWGGPISGASMNPARSFGPALAAGLWTNHWLYWVGPILGAVLGAIVYELIRERKA